MIGNETLDRNKGIALWRQIQVLLEGKIVSGELQPGARLPTEMDLSGRLGVNRHTVRRALKALEDQGLIRVEHGRGAFVQEQLIHYPLGKRTRFSEILSRQSRIPGGRVLSSQELAADNNVSGKLSVPVGSKILCMESAHEADGRVISVCRHHFPLPRFTGLIELYKQVGSITESLKQLGVSDYTRKETRITARTATAKDARLLAQPKSKPILYVEAINVDLDGIPIEYGATRIASELVQLVVVT